MSTTPPPEPRTTLEVGKSQNADLVRIYAVDNLVGETCNQHPPSLQLSEGRSGVRQLRDTFYRSYDRIVELGPQAATPFLVPANRRRQLFGSRLGSGQSAAHRPRISLSIRRLTASQGSSSIVPASIASIRRRISASQAASASGSPGPSRLANTSAASSARSFSPRRSASARTALAAFVMSGIVRSATPPNNPLDPSARPVTGRAGQEAQPAPVRSSGQRERYADSDWRGAVKLGEGKNTQVVGVGWYRREQWPLLKSGGGRFREARRHL